MRYLNKIIEKSALLRCFNYLRINYDQRFRYNLLYPIYITIFSGIIFNISGEEGHSIAAKFVIGAQAILSKSETLLALMPPFFLAALAAIVRLTGVEKFDKPFPSEQRVQLLMLRSHQEWKWEQITPKHFISLAIGYSFLISIIVITLSVINEPIGEVLPTLPFVSFQFFLSYLILFFLGQILILMLLVVYYLSDYVYRR